MRKIIYHIKKWNEWRKGSLNNPIYKLLVLFKLAKSPTFDWFWTKEETEQFIRGFEIGVGRIESEVDLYYYKKY